MAVVKDFINFLNCKITDVIIAIKLITANLPTSMFFTNSFILFIKLTMPLVSHFDAEVEPAILSTVSFSSAA